MFINDHQRYLLEGGCWHSRNKLNPTASLHGKVYGHGRIGYEVHSSKICKLNFKLHFMVTFKKTDIGKRKLVLKGT